MGACFCSGACRNSAGQWIGCPVAGGSHPMTGAYPHWEYLPHCPSPVPALEPVDIEAIIRRVIREELGKSENK